MLRGTSSHVRPGHRKIRDFAAHRAPPARTWRGQVEIISRHNRPSSEDKADKGNVRAAISEGRVGSDLNLDSNNSNDVSAALEMICCARLPTHHRASVRASNTYSYASGIGIALVGSREQLTIPRYRYCGFWMRELAQSASKEKIIRRCLARGPSKANRYAGVEISPAVTRIAFVAAIG